MSTAFTSLAIATGFERRYGVIKRLGASPLPRSGLLAGQGRALLIVEALQLVVHLRRRPGPGLGARTAGHRDRRCAHGRARHRGFRLARAPRRRRAACRGDPRAANLVYLLLMAGGGGRAAAASVRRLGASLSWLPSGALGEAHALRVRATPTSPARPARAARLGGRRHGAHGQDLQVGVTRTCSTASRGGCGRSPWPTWSPTSASCVTGGAVRLTGSGLGCPTWPRCTDASFTPHGALGLHGAIEFGNRLLTFVLAAVAVATLPRRAGAGPAATCAGSRCVLGLGIPAQAVLGGITVLTDLNPWIVAVHFLLSMAMIGVCRAAPAAARRSPRPRAGTAASRALAWATFASAWVVLYLGTVVTGTGPHAGDTDSPATASTRAGRQVHADAVFLLVGLTVGLLVALRGRAPAAAARAAPCCSRRGAPGRCRLRAVLPRPAGRPGRSTCSAPRCSQRPPPSPCCTSGRACGSTSWKVWKDLCAPIARDPDSPMRSDPVQAAEGSVCIGLSRSGWTLVERLRSSPDQTCPRSSTARGRSLMWPRPNPPRAEFRMGSIFAAICSHLVAAIRDGSKSGPSVRCADRDR